MGTRMLSKRTADGRMVEEGGRTSEESQVHRTLDLECGEPETDFAVIPTWSEALTDTFQVMSSYRSHSNLRQCGRKHGYRDVLSVQYRSTERIEVRER